jgi:type II secretion system protein C
VSPRTDPPVDPRVRRVPVQTPLGRGVRVPRPAGQPQPPPPRRVVRAAREQETSSENFSVEAGPEERAIVDGILETIGEREYYESPPPVIEDVVPVPPILDPCLSERTQWKPLLAALKVQAVVLAKGFRRLWERPGRRPYMVAVLVMPILGLWVLLPLGSPAAVQAQTSGPGAPPPALGAAAAPGRVVDSGVFRRRNPFHLKQDPDPVRPSPQQTPPPVPTPPPVDLNSKLTLLGTFIMDKTRYAIIQENGKREDVFGVGDSPLQGSKIVAINPKEVRLTMNGAEAILRIDWKGWSVSGPVAVAPIAQPPVEPQAPPVPNAADGAVRRLPRNEVDSYLDNLNTLLTQVNIQPVFQAGQPAGFRLTDIQKGTILDQIGVQDGDTLRFVNGQRIDSVQSAFQLYNILKESTNVEITVLRNTRPVTLRYVIY